MHVAFIGDLMCKYIFLRSLRLVGYRQYTWLIHGFLRRRRRKVIPACAVSAIRREYPETDPSLYRVIEEAEGEEDTFWPG